MKSMTSKAAKYFEKKGYKKLASHEKREAAGKEEDTKSIAMAEERAMKGAPSELKQYEAKEHAAMGYREGGGIHQKGRGPAKMVKMNCGGGMKGYAKGGKIDGIAQKGKTKCKIR